MAVVKEVAHAMYKGLPKNVDYRPSQTLGFLGEAMTIETIGKFRRVSKDLQAVCVEFTEDLKRVWGNDKEAIKALRETRETLSEIQSTLDVLDLGLARIEQLRVQARRGRLKVVKGLGKGEG